MVLWVTGGFYLFIFPARPLRRGAGQEKKVRRRNMGGTRGRQQDAILAQEREGGGNQTCVGAFRLRAFRFAFGKRWGIEHDEVKLAPGNLLQPNKGVSLDTLLAAARDGRMTAIEGEIAARSRQRMLTDVHAANRLGAATRGIDGKSSRITKKIQNLPARRQLLDFAAVLPLIQEESCLLPS